MQRTRPKATDFVICYIHYGLLITVVYAAFQVWRIILHMGVLTIFGQSYANQLLYTVSVLVIGIARFAVILPGGPYVRGGIRVQHVLPWFSRLPLPVGVAIVPGLVLHQLLYLSDLAA